MYKLKLLKGVRVEITVPNGTNTGETEFNPDDYKIIVDNGGGNNFFSSWHGNHDR